MNQDPQSNLIELSRNPYPGRGILVGLDYSGIFITLIYWVMGRSESSRNRVFGYDQKTGRVFTEAADPTKMKDPSLIIYDAMMERDGVFAISNGHQTNDIISAGFTQAAHKWSYEPDEPNFTPRIMAICDGNEKTAIQFAIIKKGKEEGSVDRHFYAYDYDYVLRMKGTGLCITTYSGDGDPLPSFEGRPFLLPLGTSGSIPAAQKIWECLNAENRVAMAVKTISRANGSSIIHVINKYQKVQ